jgi:tRNA dimethylallyltransferase
MKKDKILTLVGPTASGKTAISYLLSKHIKRYFSKDVEIISADSRQVYKHISIASSQPPKEYLNKFKHYFINELELNEEFNAGDFGRKGREIISDILTRGHVPIIVGGSGLYISSLIYGLFDFEDAVEDEENSSRQKEIRSGLYEKKSKEGIERLFNELKKVDLESYKKMTIRNERRIIRALEVFYMTGIPLSVLQSKKIEIGYEPVVFGLKWEREKLYENINNRVDKMLKDGLVEEIETLHDKGYNYSDFNSLNTVGVKEVFDHLDGKIDYVTMIELIKRNTRRFAKRQMTWFRKDKNINWIETSGDDLDKTSNEIVNLFFDKSRK